jgi:hypothetical protein
MNFFKSSSVFLVLFSVKLLAVEHNAQTDYFINGKSLSPWELSLAFGQDKLENNSGKTLRGSLTAKPATKDNDNDAIRLTWKPKGIKNKWGTENKNVLTANVMNSINVTDLSSFVDNGVLLVDMKVVKPPKKTVELTMECNWNWKCRSSFPLKNGLKRLPKNEWVSVPIPLKCFAKNNFDFSKVTTPFMIYTGGKMTIEIANVRLATVEGSTQC